MNKKKERIIELDVYKREMILEYLGHKQHSSTKELFDEKHCYFPELTDILQNLKISKKSPLYLFVLIAAKPRPKNGDQKTQSNFRFILEDETKFYKLKTHDALLRYALGNMLELLNLATYIYANISQENKKFRVNVLRLLMIAALTEYNNMYGSRSKHEFAYYLKRFIENHKDLSTEVKSFNTNTSKSENAKAIKELKSNIDSFSSNQDITTLNVVNVAIIFGKIAVKWSSDTKEQYFIELGVINPFLIFKKPLYQKIFITNFK